MDGQRGKPQNSSSSRNSLENLIEYADQADKRLGISKTASSFQSKLAKTLQPNIRRDGNGESVEAEIDGDRIRYRADLWAVVDLVREKRPLIHCITNFVSMDIIANGLLAVGATPAMIHSPEELPQVISTLKQTNGVLYINIGTLSEEWIRSFKTAVSVAATHNIPWVLDPLAVGFTQLRSKTVKELLAIQPPAVIKGSKSEILAIAKILSNDRKSTSEDVLASAPPGGYSSNETLDAAVKIAMRLGCVVCVSDEAREIRTGTMVYQVSPGLFVTNGETVLQVCVWRIF
eukprot:c5506_g1_i2.p1 GENE.c5506_g1_i2~~c5506_g1_i2.p1  ORF type:complete len:289 (+),score=66.63 c5506_g1_i2:58-924(+)